MGRLVYVREVCVRPCSSSLGDEPLYKIEQHPLTTGWRILQDREAEPRFTGPRSSGDFGGAPRGGFGGGYGGATAAGGGGGRQIYISNVCSPSTSKKIDDVGVYMLTICALAPFQRRLARSEGLISPSR
jgi:hypothetical protein